MVELPPELQWALDAAPHSPPELVDSRTNEHYVLLRLDVYQRLNGSNQHVPPGDFEVPEGIRRCRAALALDLPGLLTDRRTRGRWVCYRLGERVAAARDKAELVRECVGRAFKDDEYLIVKVEPGAAADDEEVDRSLAELDDEGGD